MSIYLSSRSKASVLIFYIIKIKLSDYFKPLATRPRPWSPADAGHDPAGEITLCLSDAQAWNPAAPNVEAASQFGWDARVVAAI